MLFVYAFWFAVAALIIGVISALAAIFLVKDENDRKINIALAIFVAILAVAVIIVSGHNFPENTIQNPRLYQLPVCAKCIFLVLMRILPT